MRRTFGAHIHANLKGFDEEGIRTLPCVKFEKQKK